MTYGKYKTYGGSTTVFISTSKIKPLFKCFNFITQQVLKWNLKIGNKFVIVNIIKQYVLLYLLKLAKQDPWWKKSQEVDACNVPYELWKVNHKL